MSHLVGTIAVMAIDSAPDALAAQREVWRRIGPVARVHLAVEISEEARRIALAGVRSREPTVSETELRWRLLRNLYSLDGGPASPP